jgi:hypothetical protein
MAGKSQQITTDTAGNSRPVITDTAGKSWPITTDKRGGKLPNQVSDSELMPQQRTRKQWHIGVSDW